MQTSLAVLGFVLGVLAWWQTQDWRWAVGAALMIANWPFTLIIIIMPTNNRLMTMEAGPASRALVERWGHLHAVRSAFGIAATVVFLASSLP
jgi:hypothetical protein